MRARGAGYLVNTASAAGLITSLPSATYAVSKHAAIALAEYLAIAHGDVVRAGFAARSVAAHAAAARCHLADHVAPHHPIEAGIAEGAGPRRTRLRPFRSGVGRYRAITRAITREVDPGSGARSRDHRRHRCRPILGYRGRDPLDRRPHLCGVGAGCQRHLQVGGAGPVEPVAQQVQRHRGGAGVHRHIVDGREHRGLVVAGGGGQPDGVAGLDVEAGTQPAGGQSAVTAGQAGESGEGCRVVGAGVEGPAEMSGCVRRPAVAQGQCAESIVGVRVGGVEGEDGQVVLLSGGVVVATETNPQIFVRHDAYDQGTVTVVATGNTCTGTSSARWAIRSSTEPVWSGVVPTTTTRPDGPTLRRRGVKNS